MTHSHKVLGHIPFQIKSIPCSPSPYYIYKKKWQVGTSAWTLRPALAICSQNRTRLAPECVKSCIWGFPIWECLGKSHVPVEGQHKHPEQLTSLLRVSKQASPHRGGQHHLSLNSISSKTETAVGSQSNFQFSFFFLFWNYFLQQQQRHGWFLGKEKRAHENPSSKTSSHRGLETGNHFQDELAYLWC